MTIRLGKTDASGDKRLSFFICSYVLLSSLNIAVKTIINIPESRWGLVSNLFQLPIIILLLIAIPIIIVRKLNALVVSEAVFVILYGVSFLMGYAERGLLFNTAFWTLCVCIPIGIAGVAIYDRTILFSKLRKTSYFEFFFLIIALYRMRELKSYSMSVSYAIVLPILFLFNDYFTDNKKSSLFFAVLGSLTVLLFGARGPLICILFYCFVRIFFNNKITKTGYKTFFTRILVLVLVLCIVVFWDKILVWVESFAQGYKLDTYVIRRILSGQIFSSDARSDFRKYYLALAYQKPLFGYGLMGGWIQSGAGPHNMLIELLLAFGCIIGSVFCILAIMLLVKSIFTIRNNELVLILAALNITLFLVSGDWLQSPMFFLFIFLASKKKNLATNEFLSRKYSSLKMGEISNV